MSDATIAAIARNLAAAVSSAGYSRDAEDKKRVAMLMTELCAARRTEIAEEEAAKESKS